jgi:hypothetical protein
VNEEFAIDPFALGGSNLRYAKRVFDRLGFHSGLFAAGIPLDWIESVRRLANERGVSELDRKRLLQIAKAASKEWLLPRLDFPATGNWIDRARQAYEAGLVEGLISDASGDGCFSWEDIVVGDEAERLRPRHSCLVETTVDGYLAAFRPLIMKSSELHLIDSYAYSMVSPGQKARWKDFFLGVQSIASQSSRPTYRFVIHLWRQRPGIPCDDYIAKKVAEFNSLLERHAGPPLVLEIFYRDDEIEHDRYILGVQGAMSLGRGVFLGGSEETLVSYLSKDTFAAVYEKHVSRSYKSGFSKAS